MGDTYGAWDGDDVVKKKKVVIGLIFNTIKEYELESSYESSIDDTVLIEDNEVNKQMIVEVNLLL